MYVRIVTVLCIQYTVKKIIHPSPNFLTFIKIRFFFNISIFIFNHVQYIKDQRFILINFLWIFLSIDNEWVRVRYRNFQILGSYYCCIRIQYWYSTDMWCLGRWCHSFLVRCCCCCYSIFAATTTTIRIYCTCTAHSLLLLLLSPQLTDTTVTTVTVLPRATTVNILPTVTTVQ